MNDVERVLGALQEFKDNTKDRLDKIEAKLDSLNQWKWKVGGGLALMVFLVGSALKLISP